MANQLQLIHQGNNSNNGNTNIIYMLMAPSGTLAKIYIYIIQVTRGEREIGVKLHSIVTQSSQRSTTTVWVDRCEN